MQTEYALLLLISNIILAFAWFRHVLNHKKKPIEQNGINIEMQIFPNGKCYVIVKDDSGNDLLSSIDYVKRNEGLRIINLITEGTDWPYKEIEK